MVVTSLASQLKQLEAPQTSLLVHRTKKASFLFTEKEAANFDRDSIYELGLSGLEELKKLNQDFIVFEKTLFDLSSKSFERVVQTAEVNEKLNRNIKEISILLSPYFLLKPVHKVLEWLINRFHIHQFNMDELLLLGLPYHETMTFARLLQLFPLSEDKGKWNWLAPVKKAGVPLSKTALLNRAATDTAFFKFVCDMPVEATKVYGEKGGALTTLFSFYCTTVVGGLETAKEVTDLHVSLLLPSIMEALSSRHVDFTSSAYIILARLATKTKLSDKLVSTLYNKLSKVKGDQLKNETTLLFIVLSQSSECILSRSAITRLVSLRHLINSLNYWSSRGLVTLPFIKNLLTASLQAIQDSSTEPSYITLFQTFVDNLLTLTFDDSEAITIFKVLINEWKGLQEEWYKDTLKQFQISCPQAFDSASSEALTIPSQAAVLRKLLGLTSSRNSIFDNLVHPSPDIRREAVKTITNSFTPDQVGWLSETVIARLEDDSPAVVGAALACKPVLSQADKILLFSTLQRSLIRCWSNDSHRINLKTTLKTLLMYQPDSSSLLDLVLFPVLVTDISLILGSKIPQTESRLINFIKQKLENGMKKSCCTWSALEEDALPKYSEASSYLPKLCQIHPVFRFLALLLLAREPTSFDSTLLSDYLDSEMIAIAGNDYLKDGKSLKKCMNICKEGQLPLQPGLYYLSKSTLCMKELLNSSPADDSLKIGCPDMSSPTYQPILSVFKIFVEGCGSKNKNMRKIFKRAIETLFEENFPLNENRMYFLLSCAVHMVDKDVNASIACIKHLLSMFSKNKKNQSDSEIEGTLENESCLLTSVMSLSSPAIPLLATLLHSPNSMLRNDVVKIFSSLVESFSPIPGYRALVEQIISNSEELKLDPEQITILCYTQLSPVKEIRSLLPSDVKSHMKNALNSIMSLVTSSETPIYVAANVLEILECVNSSEILIKLLPVLNTLIGKDLVLDTPQSTVVKLILKKFDDSQVESFIREDVWTAFDNILSDSVTTLKENENETTTPAAYLINLLPSLLFDNLADQKGEKQKRFLSCIITKTYECDNIKVTNSVSNFFKKVTIEGEIIASFLTMWFDNTSHPVKMTPGSKKIRKSISNIPSLEILETPEWKKGVFLLEQIQSKNKFTDCTFLIPALFNVLKKCLLFEHQAPVEYSKQLILSVLLQCCQSIGLSPISPELIQVDLIVQCLRISQNPQTHHHALLTLTIIANILPDNVLHSIMEIFTFIGTSIARQDDAYSFQIISKLVETIIPILVKGRENEVVGVVRVFVAAMLDIPEHRRHVLLLKLIKTLGPAKHLWLFLALVFESHVFKHSSLQNKESGKNESNATPKKLEVASQLCSEFDVPTLLETSARLLELANTFPHDKDENTEVRLPKVMNEIFNIKSNTGKQLRHFKYTLLGFLSSLLSSDMFIQQIALMSEEESSELEDDLKRVMELCLNYVKELSRHQEKINSLQSTLPASKYWKVMINQAYDVLDKVVGVLPVSSFVSVVSWLLQDEGCCPRKVVELVIWRLGQGRPASPALLHPLLKPLTNISFSNTLDPMTRQTALIALKLLTRHLASSYMQEFGQVLERLTDILCSETLPPWEVTGSLVLCLGELTSSLGAHSISQLSRFMPALLQILQDNCNNGELFILSCVTCLHKIVDTLSNFLSPYLEKIIYRICYLLACVQGSEAQEKTVPVVSKLKSIRSKLACSIEGRVLVPAVSGCYFKMLKRGEVNAVAPLMALLTESFSSGVKAIPELSSLLLQALAFRSEATDLNTVDLVEPHVLSTLTALVLKLSESAFRPLYHKIYDWAIRGSSDPHRAITFYRLSCGLAEKLRGLFVLFAGLLVPNCASLLEKYNKSKEITLLTSEEGCILLVESIIKMLTSVFTYDSHNFLNKERFDLIMQPLVDQLDNELGGAEIRMERNEKLLTVCLASMAGATGDDSLWKQLNYQILLKMRHPHPQVRLAALESVHQIAKKLGEDFLPLLPETVPFLAELLEDSDESIEKQTHRAIASMEAVLGEPIQKYF